MSCGSISFVQISMWVYILPSLHHVCVCVSCVSISFVHVCITVGVNTNILHHVYVSPMGVSVLYMYMYHCGCKYYHPFTMCVYVLWEYQLCTIYHCGCKYYHPFTMCVYVLWEYQLCTCMGQYSESVYFGPLKVREKKCLRNGKSFVELENYVALWLH